MLESFSRRFLTLLGWQLERRLPDTNKYLVIGAFHTSNWDLPMGLLGLWALGLKSRWIAKHTLFRWPLGPLLKAIGGIPVDRRTHTGFIDKIAAAYDAGDTFVVTIAPEGTRAKTDYWKTGFYFIALAAKVPIALGYIDYPNKRLGIGGFLYPCGDIEADMVIIRNFYRDKTGLKPENQGEIRLKQLP
jgi:1-acyl-sn-glycerol-3-phosphate acyltransferase